MKTNKSIIRLVAIATLIAISLTLISCEQRLDNKKPSGENIDIEDIVGSIDTSISDNDLDGSYLESDATRITFADSGATVSGSGASASGSNVTITGEGVYFVTGSASNGSLTVNSSSASNVQIVLSGLDLTNENGPAINVKNAKKVTVTLEKGSVNTISDGDSYSIPDGSAYIDGAIFSKSNLVFNGEGELTVYGNNAHAIVSKDNITVTGGKYTVVSKKAGLFGKDAVKISGADIKVEAGTDAIKSDNALDSTKGYIHISSGTLELQSQNDAIQAYTVVSIEGGRIKIKTTGTSSTLSSKGIKGGSGIAISGGDFVIDSKDDSIHSNGDVAITGGSFVINSGDDGIHADKTVGISGGNIRISKSFEGIEGTAIIITDGYVDITSNDDGMNASGGNDGAVNGDMFGSAKGSISISGGYIIVHNEGDGIDSNGSLEISGGIVLVDGPSRGGNSSFDYDTTAKITGGVVITLGTSDMAQNFSEATQGSILVRAEGYFTAGTTLSLCDEEGNVILAFTSTKNFNGALFSAPELVKGKTYTFYTGATVAGLDENGYAHNTTKTGGESCGSVTLSSLISGQGSGMPGGGGFPGGRPR